MKWVCLSIVLVASAVVTAPPASLGQASTSCQVLVLLDRPELEVVTATSVGDQWVVNVTIQDRVYSVITNNGRQWFFVDEVWPFPTVLEVLSLPAGSVVPVLVEATEQDDVNDHGSESQIAKVDCEKRQVQKLLLNVEVQENTGTGQTSDFKSIWHFEIWVVMMSPP